MFLAQVTQWQLADFPQSLSPHRSMLSDCDIPRSQLYKGQAGTLCSHSPIAFDSRRLDYPCVLYRVHYKAEPAPSHEFARF